MEIEKAEKEARKKRKEIKKAEKEAKKKRKEIEKARKSVERAKAREDRKKEAKRSLHNNPLSLQTPFQPITPTNDLQDLGVLNIVNSEYLSDERMDIESDDINTSVLPSFISPDLNHLNSTLIQENNSPQPSFNDCLDSILASNTPSVPLNEYLDTIKLQNEF